MTEHDAIDILNNLKAGLSKLSRLANSAVCSGHPEFHMIESSCQRDIMYIDEVTKNYPNRTAWVHSEVPLIMKWANENYKRLKAI